MKDIIIDSCVFFGMIKYNNFVEKYGEDGLSELLEHQAQKLADIKAEIESCFSDAFNQKYQNLSFEEKIEKFKEYHNNKISKLESSIAGKQQLLDGSALSKTGKPIIIPEERKEFLRQQLEKERQQLAVYKTYCETESTIDFNRYKVLKNSLQNGQLYQMSLEGKVNLHLFYESYNEIVNHTKHKRDDKSWLYFTPEEVYNLTKKHCHIIHTHSSQVVADLKEMSEKYRTPVTDEIMRKEMDNDRNSLNKFGDSLIMAGASMSGMILVTQNDKDFIVDKSHKQSNDYIRRNIHSINSQNDCVSDAVCYNVDEFLSQNYTEPTKFSKKYTLVETNKTPDKFLSEIHIVKRN